MCKLPSFSNSPLPDDDGWAQVCHLPRGVRLCRDRHLPRHPQPVPQDSQAHGNREAEMKRVLIDIKRTVVGHVSVEQS